MHIQTKSRIRTKRTRLAGDLFTPVNLFLSLRDHYADLVLLESNNFKSIEDCHSFIGVETIASFEVKQGQISICYPGEIPVKTRVESHSSVADAFFEFLQKLKPEEAENGFDGVFGHTNFDSIQYFETLSLDPSKRKINIPDMRYNMYKYIIIFNHFNDHIEIVEHLQDDEASDIAKLIARMKANKFHQYGFTPLGEETSNIGDEAFKSLVRTGKKHCHLGDVFQIVFSRQYSQSFNGDDFNVYRALRSINPSPYLFYFDYGDYKIFGSSPETQMMIEEGKARINPIAGTYRRSGIHSIDELKTKELQTDPKENAEHIMLVDLARNDLGRHANNIIVKELKEVQYFSHVIHLVSRVEGDLPEDSNPIAVFGDTFPAGTLSGAPKYKAMQLIDQYENQNRGIYGGALGYVNFNGHMNQAIIIRSFLSKDNTLYYQAGAGVVADSDPDKELQEVKNKLGALNKAISVAANQFSMQ